MMARRKPRGAHPPVRSLPAARSSSPPWPRRRRRGARVPGDSQVSSVGFEPAFSGRLVRKGHPSRIRARFRREGPRHGTGGELRIDMLPAGAVVNALRASSTPCRRARSMAVTAQLSRRSPINRTMRSRCGVADRLSAWMRTCCSRGTSTAAARALLEKLYKTVGANVVSFLCGPMPTQPLGWFRKPIRPRPDDLKGLKFRASGMASEVLIGRSAPQRSELPAPDRDRRRRWRAAGSQTAPR